jgi:hypothetical protein
MSCYRREEVLVKITSALIALGFAFAQPSFAQSSTADTSDGIAQLQVTLDSQQKQIQSQEKRLASQEKQLQDQSKEIEELKAMIRGGQNAAAAASGRPELATATGQSASDAPSVTISGLHSNTGIAPSLNLPTLGSTSSSGGRQAQPPNPENALPVVPEGFNPTQEVMGEVPEEPEITIGPAQLKFSGYLGLTGIYRSTNSGGGPGTSFGTIPLSTSGQGNVSEARLTAGSSRISLRVDAPFPERNVFTRLSGYFEMDFNGSTSGTVAVTSTSAGFRLRHAFGEVEYSKKFFLAAGQAFTLMTPQKDQISIWPSDVEMSQSVDTNYLAGMVWGRLPQVRLTWRPSTMFNWAFSIENPEQELGKSNVTLPLCCASDISNEYNTGSDELKVPNLMPDYQTRVAFNTKTFHLDVGGVLRVFRQSIAPYSTETKQVGGGGNVNMSVRLLKSTKLLVQGSYGAGMGRYIGGLVPDVSFKADGTISPIITTSWVTGVEQKLTKNLSGALYYSGLYADRSWGTDTNGSFIGYGYPGSPDSQNRSIVEATGTLSYRFFKTENRGSAQWNTQFSWLERNYWSRVAGTGYADSFMFFTMLRYNLP